MTDAPVKITDLPDATTPLSDGDLTFIYQNGHLKKTNKANLVLNPIAGGTMALQNANNVNISGGSIQGVNINGLTPARCADLANGTLNINGTAGRIKVTNTGNSSTVDLDFTFNGLAKVNGSGSITAASPGVDYVTPTAVTTYSAQQVFGLASVTDAASISWNLATQQVGTITLTGNHILLNPTNQIAGGVYRLIIKQDATGSRNLDYGSAYKWAGGLSPNLTSAANSVDIAEFVSDGTYMYGTIQQAFAAPLTLTTWGSGTQITWADGTVMTWSS